MKNTLGLSALALLLLTGCGNDASAPAEPVEETTPANETAPVEEAAEAPAAEETEFETQVGDTIENEAGSFTLLKRNSDVEPITTGNFVIEIPQVNAVSGTVNESYIETFGGEELEYIQIDMDIAHNADSNESIYANIAQITTSTGEQLDPDMFFSENIDGDFVGNVSKQGANYYILQNSKAADVEWVRLLIEAPVNTETYETAGEKVDIQIPLK